MPEDTATPTLDEAAPPQPTAITPDAADALVDDVVAKTVPKPRKQPQDHKKSAAQAEADGDETITITWNGKDVTFPASADEWSVETTMALENGRVLNWISGLLGPGRFGRLLADWREEHGRTMKNKDLAPLAEEILKALGFDGLGEA